MKSGFAENTLLNSSLPFSGPLFLWEISMWRVYDDETIVEGEKAELLEKRLGIIAIVQKRELTGREVLNFWDWYYFKEGYWYGADLFGIQDQILHFTDKIDCVLAGRMIKDSMYQKIIARALSDPGFPRRSAEPSQEEKGRR